jgi:hypothetical protein
MPLIAIPSQRSVVAVALVHKEPRPVAKKLRASDALRASPYARLPLPPPTAFLTVSQWPGTVEPDPRHLQRGVTRRARSLVVIGWLYGGNAVTPRCTIARSHARDRINDPFLAITQPDFPRSPRSLVASFLPSKVLKTSEAAKHSQPQNVIGMERLYGRRA